MTHRLMQLHHDIMPRLDGEHIAGPRIGFAVPKLEPTPVEYPVLSEAEALQRDIDDQKARSFFAQQVELTAKRLERFDGIMVDGSEAYPVEYKFDFKTAGKDLGDGWIEWKGGECPVEKGALIEVNLGDGTIDTGYAGNYGWAWYVNGGFSDIIAYRLSKPAKKPAVANDGWITHDGSGVPPAIMALPESADIEILRRNGLNDIVSKGSEMSLYNLWEYGHGISECGSDRIAYRIVERGQCSS